MFVIDYTPADIIPSPTRRRRPKASAAWRLSLAAALAALAATGCHGRSAGESPSGNAADTGLQPAVSSSMRGSDVVAVVNGDSVTTGELFDALQHYVPTRVSNYPNNPDLARPSGRAALKNLIISAVALQFAKQNGVPVTADELSASYNDQALLQSAKTTMPFDSVLQGQGYTVDSYKREVLAPQVAQFNLVQKAENITPADVQTQYNATQSQFVIPARVHVHRIVSATKQDADNVYSGIKAGQQMSHYAGVNLATPDDGGNPADGTDLATWLDANMAGALGKSVAAQLFKAKTGDLLPPAQVQGRWWVIQVVDAKPRQPLPFNQVSNLVRANLVRSRGASAGPQVQQQFLQALHAARITIGRPEYDSVAMEIHMAGITPPPQDQPQTRPQPQSPAPAVKK